MARQEVRKYMEATMEKLSPARAQEMARSVMKGERRDQVQRFAKDLLDWSNKSRQRVTDVVQREVKSQLKTFGVAGRDEVDALKRRVRELERRLGETAGPAKAPSRSKRAGAGSRAKRTSSGTSKG
jgi:polyhydroxyalkanoate synthesis regulator phasin